MPPISELKKEVKELDRDVNDTNNMYGRYKKVRKTVRERNINLAE